MNRFIAFVLPFLAAFALIQPVDGQSANGLLYEISGNNLARPSYIFGTIHAICPADMLPVDGLQPYISRTDQMLMEIDMDDPVEMGSMSKTIFIGGGKTLRDFLNPEQFSKVDEMTRSLRGMPAENLKTLKPSVLSVMMVTSPKALGCTPSVYDMLLMQSAVEKKMPVIGLETVASQVNVLDSRPMDKQAKDLYDLALDPQKRIQELKSLISVYKTQDAEKLFDFTRSGLSTDKEFESKLLDDRNSAWIPKIESAIKEKPTFIAVGAAHLGGKVGVINLLRSKGYSVRPIKINKEP
jgi:uncharacterized protein YbaP (TraB family)